jgi:TRAP-type C4-dicarboxylate transport system substrate-binding protein
MRYKDKATIKQVTNHQNKPETIYYGQNMTNRQRERIRERWLKDFRLKVYDKIWWDSLNDNDQTEVAHEYKQTKEGNNLKELMEKYPGNKAYIRQEKLNQLGI